MKAMILAAGLGTRLRPLTDSRPKALVEVAGRTMLEITLERLRAFGILDVIINVHHFPDQILAYLKENQNFGMRIDVSREDDLLLDTGGGLKKAAHFFTSESKNSGEPFILHNVDVISNIDLDRMIRTHRETAALATLAVQNRDTARPLLFDQAGQFRDRASGSKDTNQSKAAQALAFCGIHAISPRIFSLMTGQGVFSIIDVYVRLAAAGEKILAFRADDYYWRDLGKPEQIPQAAEDLKQGALR